MEMPADGQPDDKPQPERTGPSDATLKAFLPELKKFIKAHPVESRIHRPRGHTVRGEQHAIPRFFCGICLGLSKELKPVNDQTPPKERDCDECRKELELGKIAINCPDGRYCFVYNSVLAETLEQSALDSAKAGKIIPCDRTTIGNAEFNFLEQHVKRNQEKQKEANGE